MRRWISPVIAVIVLTALAVSAIVISTALLLWNLRGKELAHARSETVALSHALSEQTTRSIQNVDLVVLNVLAALPSVMQSDPTLSDRATYKLLRNALIGMPQIKYVFITDAEGTMTATSRVFPGDGIKVPDREYFKVHRDGPPIGLFIGAPTRNRVDGAMTLYLSRRITGLRGEFRGVIAVALNLPNFESLYETISFDGIAPISLYLADGTLIARSPHDEPAVGVRAAGASAMQFKEGDDGRTLLEEASPGLRQIISYHPVSQFPLLVSVAIDENIVLAEWHETARPLLAGALGSALFIVVAAGALVRELKKDEYLTNALRESGERLRVIIQSALDAIVVADVARRVIVFNRAAETMFGCSARDAIGSSLERFLPERTSIDDPASSYAETVGLRSDGTRFPIESAFTQIKLGGDTLNMAILRDVTERRRVEAQLLASNRQLRELSESLQTVREEERARIARELHDELGQQLTGLKLDLSWLDNHMQDEHTDLLEKVDGMRQQIDGTIKSVRRIATELRPTLLDDLGLAAAIEWLATDFSRRTGIVVDLDLAAEKCAQGDAMITALFRIMQEGLTNVARHAEATHVRISLLRMDGHLELTINDNGKGMVPGNTDGHRGLVGIRERSLLLGGEVDFSAQSGKGASIKVTIPLPDDALTGASA